MSQATDRPKKRQSMGVTQVVVQATPAGTRGFAPGMSVTRRSNVLSTTRSMGPSMHHGQGEVGKLSKEAFQTITGNRDKEKRDMAELNAKLANRIENTKFLEATCQAYLDEIARLKKGKGYNQDRVRLELQDEITDAKDALLELKTRLSELEAENLSLADKVATRDLEVDDIKKQRDELLGEINKLSSMITNLEGEIEANRRMVENADREKRCLKADIDRLYADNERIRGDCDAARQGQIEAKYCQAALEEENAYLKDSYEMEIEELRNALKEMENVTPKIQDKWKSDFKEMIKVIQDDYNDRVNIMEKECQRRYDDQLIAYRNAQPKETVDHISKVENKNLKSTLSQNKSKLLDLERENAHLKDELDRLRKQRDEECDECEKEKMELKNELDELQDELGEVNAVLGEMRASKLSLELEISCYRKLLEGEERNMASNIEQQSNMQSYGGSALASIVGGSGGGGQSTQSSMSETGGTVRVQKTSKGSVGIKDIHQGGSYVIVNNTNRSKEVNIGRWTLERKSGKGANEKINRFTFPRDTILGPGQEVKVVSKNFCEDCESGDLIADSSCKTWGIGSGQCVFRDANGDDKAICTITYQ